MVGPSETAPVLQTLGQMDLGSGLNLIRGVSWQVVAGGRTRPWGPSFW